MTKVRKQKKKKTFNRSLNRKRMRNRLDNTGNISCEPIKRAWNDHKSIRINMKNMGLAFDVNEVLKIPNFKQTQIKNARSVMNDGFTVTEEPTSKPSQPIKTDVVKELEAEAKAPRQKNRWMPKEQADFIKYLLNKYDHDYKAMARDRKNYYQETWKQLRTKVRKFMSIPEEYSKYLESKGELDNADDDELIRRDAKAMEIQ